MTNANPSNPSEAENTYPAQAKHFGGIVQVVSPSVSEVVYIGAQYPSTALLRNSVSKVVLDVMLPPATMYGLGVTGLTVFADLLSSEPIEVKSAASEPVVTLGAGDVARFYLSDNSNIGGTWHARVSS